MSDNNTNCDKAAMDLLDAAFEHNPLHLTQWLDLQKNVDDHVKRRAIELLALDDEGARLLQTGQPPLTLDKEVNIPQTIGVYKITKLIGQGGMGLVYKGERSSDDFKLDVAIKLIRPSLLSATLIEFFHRERQILAELSHPNIASLYDGGKTDQGVPYFIMEYVDGAPITSWAEKHNLTVNARLVLFKSTCEAIIHAHQNLIIHRDITPNNVLVTQAGKVKVIDFGIARPDAEEADSSKKNQTSTAFTPNFVAPERLRGDAANTLSDIYSLGKLLHALIKNKNAGEDLLSIVKKATELQPERRYVSVDALLDDIARYESGHVVKAYPAGILFTLDKFVRRQLLAVSLATFATVSLIGGLLTTSILYKRAEAARSEADTRFNEVRSIANFMLYELYDELKSKPGNTQALETIATQSRQYLTRLNDVRSGDLDLQLDMIRGFHRLADITGNPFGENLGRTTQAISIYDETHSRLVELLEQHPKHLAVMRELAQVLYSKASLAYNNEHDYTQSLKYIDEALIYLRTLSERTALGLDEQGLQIRLINLKGSSTLELNRGEEAIAVFKDFENQVKTLLEKYPEELKAKLGFAEFYHIYAYTLAWHVYNIDADDALPLPLYQLAVDTYKTLISDHPEKTSLKIALSLILSRRSETYVELEDYKAAIIDSEYASNLIRRARIIAPEDQRLASVYVINQVGLINLWSRQGDIHKQKIQSATAEVIDIHRKDLKNNPNDVGFVQLLTNTLQMSAEALYQVGEIKQACTYIVEAVSYIDEYDKRIITSDGDVKNILLPARNMEEKCNNNMPSKVDSLQQAKS